MQGLRPDAKYVTETSRGSERKLARYSLPGRHISAHMPLRTRNACAYVHQTEMASTLAFRTTNATANVVRTTRATASAFWTRSVRAFASPRGASLTDAD